MTTDPLQALPIEGYSPLQNDWGQRLFDLLFCLLLAPILLPIMLILALLVRFSSTGPVFYSQPRVGRDQKLFRCYKLRTMHLNADQHLKELLGSCAQLRAEWESHQKLQQDPRVTRLGSWLRKSSMDELPQLWNVIRGDMSLVGPRPYLVEQLATRTGDELSAITAVRPGLTGLWQTSGRSRLSFEERVALDVTYAQSRSLRSDLALLLKTIPMVLAGRDAC
jgi:exopolysaccharide production protein ExoY